MPYFWIAWWWEAGLWAEAWIETVYPVKCKDNWCGFVDEKPDDSKPFVFYWF